MLDERGSPSLWAKLFVFAFRPHEHREETLLIFQPNGIADGDRVGSAPLSARGSDDFHIGVIGNGRIDIMGMSRRNVIDSLVELLDGDHIAASGDQPWNVVEQLSF